MLSRRYGASTLAYLPQKSTRPAINFSIVSSMRSMSAISSWTRRVLATKPSPMPSSTNSRLWQPQNGIVFDASSSIRNMSSVQDTNEARTESDEVALPPLQDMAEDFYAVKDSVGTDAKSPKTNSESPPKTVAAESTDVHTIVNIAEAGEAESKNLLRSFEMAPKLFEEAKNAKPGSPESYWSHALYRRPGKSGTSKAAEEKVTVHYCKSKATSEKVAKYFTEDKIIGFDIEWRVPQKSGPKNNVSLIQIANEERIALFHIALYPKNGIDDLVAPTLKKIMEDPNITKVGVAIRADCTRLEKHLNIHSKGIFELSHLYKLVRYSASGETNLINRRLVSLETQVEEHLKLPMYKGDEVRSSDWTQPLKMDQIMYAASDSYAGLRLFDILEEQRKQLNPTPPRPYHAELGLPIRLADGIVIETTEEATEEPEPNQNQESTETITTTTTMTTSVSNAATPTKPKPKEPKEPKEKPLPCPEIQAADLWVKNWKSSLPKVHVVRAADRTLRAYSLWHIQGFSVSEICVISVLASSTVHGYILEAVQTECLGFDKGRMIELVKGVDERALRRYKRVVGQLGL